MTNFERLLAFHAAVDGSTPDRPAVPTPEKLELRATLIREEYSEALRELRDLKHRTEQQKDEQAKDTDISKVVHELVDLLYVTYGTLVEFGVNADAVFAEVHRANMRKLDGPKRADGKQLKPEGWQPADVAAVIARQGMGDAN